MIKIRVPATCANMGPGFDSLGVALSLYNEFYFEETESGLIIEGCPDEFKNEDNLAYTSCRKALSILGYNCNGIKINLKSSIPVSRGLGSSASCIVAGVAAASEIAGGELSRQDILDIAAGIEGHPDNVTPAVMGGITASVVESQKVLYSPISIPGSIEFCAIIPDFKLSTELARSVLPDMIPRRDAVSNVGRAALLVAALNSNKIELIPEATKDMLHEKYRKKLINDYDYIVECCTNANALSSFLSGAGPTIMCIIKKSNSEFEKDVSDKLKALKNNWTIIRLKPDFDGLVLS